MVKTQWWGVIQGSGRAEEWRWMGSVRLGPGWRHGGKTQNPETHHRAEQCCPRFVPQITISIRCQWVMTKEKGFQQLNGGQGALHKTEPVSSLDDFARPLIYDCPSWVFRGGDDVAFRKLIWSGKEKLVFTGYYSGLTFWGILLASAGP